jgi:hypothetical protein
LAFDASKSTLGYYAAAMQVEDFAPSNITKALSSVPGFF